MDDLFDHFCHCGKLGLFGVGDRWYCRDHYPGKERLGAPRETYPDVPGFVRNSDTSEAAADSMAIPAGRLRRIINDLIFALGGATCDEIEHRLNLRHQTCSARIRELVLMGFVIDSGARRDTRSGRSARVYISTKPSNKELERPAA